MSAPAGFWRRYAAYSLDMVLLTPALVLALWARLAAAYGQILSDLASAQLRLLELLQPTSLLGMATRSGSPTSLLNDPALRAVLQQMLEHLGAASIDTSARIAVLVSLYFIAFEASPWQASPGKRLLGLRVTDGLGQAPGLRRVVLRVLAGALSWLSLNLGHALAAWTPHKQALHDLLAGARGGCVDASPLPRWARL